MEIFVGILRKFSVICFNFDVFLEIFENIKNLFGCVFLIYGKIVNFRIFWESSGK